jgi:hypothetical protein
MSQLTLPTSLGDQNSRSKIVNGALTNLNGSKETLPFHVYSNSNLNSPRGLNKGLPNVQTSNHSLSKLIPLDPDMVDQNGRFNNNRMLRINSGQFLPKLTFLNHKHNSNYS